MVELCRKVYVDVLIKQDKDGRITPLEVIWEDGAKFRVDKVTQVCKAASMKTGVCENDIRQIQNKELSFLRRKQMVYGIEILEKRRKLNVNIDFYLVYVRTCNCYITISVKIAN